MFTEISTAARLYARPVRGVAGSWPNPDKQLIQPTPYGPARAEVMRDAARAASPYGPWTDRLSEKMTDGEIVFTLNVWDCCPGSASFMSAFCHILNGDVEGYQTAAAQVTEDPEPYALKERTQ